VREAATLDARIVTQLDFAIVRATPAEVETPGWRGIQLADRRVGFVSSQYLRSPVDHRALFQFHDGRWWLMAYVDGD